VVFGCIEGGRLVRGVEEVGSECVNGFSGVLGRYLLCNFYEFMGFGEVVLYFGMDVVSHR